MISKSQTKRLWHQIADPEESDIAKTLRLITGKVKSMSPEEFKESLVHAGILTKDGKLTTEYKQP